MGIEPVPAIGSEPSFAEPALRLQPKRSSNFIALREAALRGIDMRNLSQSDPDHALRPSHPAPQSLARFRLRRHSDYQRIYASAGRKRQSPSMSWFLAPQPPALDDSRKDAAAPRVGLTAGKILGKAHERNRIKRRLREVLRRHVDLLPAGFDLILHPRRSVLTLEFVKLEAEVVRILDQARTEAVRPASARSPAGGSAS